MFATTALFYIPFSLCLMLAIVYAERKMAAFIQDRLGPMRVGYHGILQPLADLLKLLKKEHIVPHDSEKRLFLLAPCFLLLIVLVSFSCLPVIPAWLGARTNVGFFILIAVLSLKMLGILVAGFSTPNQYARLGAMRAIAQFLSYEVPFTLSLLCTVIVSHHVDLPTIIGQQGLWQYSPVIDGFQESYLLGIKGLPINAYGGFLMWNIVRMPTLLFAYVIFFIVSFALCNRIPFDLSESESELIAGYHTEYGGIYFAWIMLSEYSLMLMISLLGIFLFLGAWYSPLPNIGCFKFAEWTNGMPNTIMGNLWAFFWFFSKLMVVIFVQLWVRWSLPRLRIDQLMQLCWHYLIPFSLLILLTTLWWQWALS